MWIIYSFAAFTAVVVSYDSIWWIAAAAATYAVLKIGEEEIMAWCFFIGVVGGVIYLMFRMFGIQL